MATFLFPFRMESLVRIVHTESSTVMGGQERRVLAESLGMRDRGHDVWVVTPPDGALASRAAAAGLEVVPMSFRRSLLPAQRPCPGCGRAPAAGGRGEHAQLGGQLDGGPRAPPGAAPRGAGSKPPHLGAREAGASAQVPVRAGRLRDHHGRVRTQEPGGVGARSVGALHVDSNRRGPGSISAAAGGAGEDAAFPRARRRRARARRGRVPETGQGPRGPAQRDAEDPGFAPALLPRRRG